MKDIRTAILLALTSALGLALASRFGGLWWLGWIAPVPVLWFAFGKTNPMAALAVALGAGALAALAHFATYFAVLPAPALGAAVALSAIGFALCVMLSRFAGRTVAPFAAPLAFAALWTVWDFVASSGPDGALVSPAYSQAAMPMMIQSASLFGGWAITFLLGAVAGFVALAFRSGNALYLLPAAALFIGNLGFGALHMAQDQGPERRVVLIDSDALAEASTVDRRDIALGAVLAYAAEIRLAAQNAGLVVLPERIAILRPAWRDEAVSYLHAVSAATGATIIAGFEARGSGAPRNIALTVTPDGKTSAYVQSGGQAPAQTAIAISHDLNFFAGMRTRMIREQSGLLAVPAWDFGADAAAESHKAILRGVENGTAIARSARDGTLLLADAQGRTIAEAHTGADGFTALSGELAAGANPGRTLYDRIGDVFVWFAAFLGAFLVLGGAARAMLGLAPARDMRERRFRPVFRPGLVRVSVAARHASIHRP